MACGAFAESGVSVDNASRIAVQAPIAVDPSRHFVIRASGDSMNGGDRPIRDGDLVLCEHRYADRFLSTTEFQWECQASTKPGDKKGQRITRP